MGAIVFFMKPGTRPSWAFLMMTFNVGLYASFVIDRGFSPAWLGSVFTYASAFFSASVLHLAQTFPVELPWVRRHRLSLWAPYGVSLGLFLIARSTGTLYIDVPILWRTIIDSALVCSLLIFLSSTFFAYVRPSSPLVRMRSRVILIGLALAMGLPIAHMTTTIFFHRPILPSIVLSSFTLIFFPLSIGYAVVRHDLFDVDVYIKRAVGYAAMTILVGIAYVSIQTLLRTVVLDPLLGESAESVSPVLFALLVVFLFNPVNQRVQGIVDRIFFRQQLDYKKTILSVTNSLTSSLDLNGIVQQIIQTVKNEMFIDTVSMGVFEPQHNRYRLFVVSDSGGVGQTHSDDLIAGEDPLFTVLAQEQRVLTQFDMEEDLRYVEVKDQCSERFSALGASLALPLTYQEEIVGALLLGQKKSGHFYTREDIELLTTLANQGAVAIENARLFSESLEKNRLEEELNIAHSIQVSMLPEKAPEIVGFQIAAKSLPAREVGGDFYDFIELPEQVGENRLGIIVGDVSGKAVSGALVMAASRSIFRVLTEIHPSIEEVMHLGNLRLKKDVQKGMFVALLYAVLDTQQKTLTLSNAGQTQPILCADRFPDPVYIETDGDRFPLGIIEASQYQTSQVVLQQGDTLVFYTDGIVEAMNTARKIYGFERFQASIAEGKSLQANALLEKLLNDVYSYVDDAEQHDDITIVVVKVA